MIVLNTYEEAGHSLTCIIVITVVTFICGFAIGIVINDQSDSVLGGLLIGVITALLVAGALTYDNIQNYPYTCYEVTFDDNAKINDILADYEIIDQKGKIYTIREIKYEHIQ